jgi:5-methylcytosine-specific restriction endonuclease McrA
MYNSRGENLLDVGNKIPSDFEGEYSRVDIEPSTEKDTADCSIISDIKKYQQFLKDLGTEGLDSEEQDYYRSEIREYFEEKLSDKDVGSRDSDLILSFLQSNGLTKKEIQAGKDVSIGEIDRQIKNLEEELRSLKKGRRYRIVTRRIAVLKRKKFCIESDYHGRRISKEMVASVQERDRDRDFGRPSHSCSEPGRPHHIKHFSDFKDGEERGNPHTENNLEAPCNDCHKLAHAIGIPSGISIKELFSCLLDEEWYKIENLWQKDKISELRQYVSEISLSKRALGEN